MNDRALQGRTALVTGAGQRLGRAIAIELARAGADLLVHYHRSGNAALETRSAIEALGGRATLLSADLTSDDEVRRLLDDAGRAAPRLDLLVNSAAIFERAPLDDLEPAQWDALLSLNLRAPYLLSRGAAPIMRKGGGGVIINIADIAGYRPWANHLHYSVSKAGLIAMTQCLALELAPAIRVNAVAPGTVLPAPFQSERSVESIRGRTPLGRLGTPAEVGEAVVFLAGASSITGQVLAVDGGRSLFSRE